MYLPLHIRNRYCHILHHYWELFCFNQQHLMAEAAIAPRRRVNFCRSFHEGTHRVLYDEARKVLKALVSTIPTPHTFDALWAYLHRQPKDVDHPLREIEVSDVWHPSMAEVPQLLNDLKTAESKATSIVLFSRVPRLSDLLRKRFEVVQKNRIQALSPARNVYRAFNSLYKEMRNYRAGNTKPYEQIICKSSMLESQFGKGLFAGEDLSDADNSVHYLAQEVVKRKDVAFIVINDDPGVLSTSLLQHFGPIETLLIIDNRFMMKAYRSGLHRLIIRPDTDLALTHIAYEARMLDDLKRFSLPASCRADYVRNVEHFRPDTSGESLF